LFNQDGTKHTITRDITMILSGGDSTDGLTQVVTTNGTPFDPEKTEQDTEHYVGDPNHPGVGQTEFGATDSLKYGTYSLSEFMPRYLGTQYETNLGFEARVRPGLIADETWSDTGANHADSFGVAGNSFTITVGVDNPEQEYTLYNRVIYPSNTEFETIKIWQGGKLDTAHGHSGNTSLVKLY